MLLSYEMRINDIVLGAVVVLEVGQSFADSKLNASRAYIRTASTLCGRQRKSDMKCWGCEAPGAVHKSTRPGTST